jgi:CubicO group peptidase (beta-lactamase class C family)
VAERDVRLLAAVRAWRAEALTYAASLSKQIRACVALLVVDGVVAVDDPLSRWLPELPDWAGRVRAIASTDTLPVACCRMCAEACRRRGPR